VLGIARLVSICRDYQAQTLRSCEIVESGDIDPTNSELVKSKDDIIANRILEGFGVPSPQGSFKVKG
jgi:hypothetical protein